MPVLCFSDSIFSDSSASALSVLWEFSSFSLLSSWDFVISEISSDLAFWFVVSVSASTSASTLTFGLLPRRFFGASSSGSLRASDSAGSAAGFSASSGSSTFFLRPRRLTGFSSSSGLPVSSMPPSKLCSWDSALSLSSISSTSCAFLICGYTFDTNFFAKFSKLQNRVVVEIIKIQFIFSLSYKINLCRLYIFDLIWP